MSLPNANDWTVIDVCEWANTCKYSSDTLERLVNNEVDGKTLLNLTCRDLREEIGIKGINERKVNLLLILILLLFTLIYSAFSVI
jgi:hypothetical protein